jgi:hypothetical protein
MPRTPSSPPSSTCKPSAWPLPRIPKAKAAGEDTWEDTKPVADEPYVPTPAPVEGGGIGFTLPEAFLLLANGGGWDERTERNKIGALGGALAGSMLLELLQQRIILVQRDRLTRTGNTTEDSAVAAIEDRLRRINEKGERPSLDAMGRLAKWDRELLLPFKQRLAERGLVEYGSRRFLGLFYRSQVTVLDEAAQDRLRNKLKRAIAGGGTPEAASILLLGLLDATGLLSSIVPEEAMEYNRKRLNGLLGGRDIMGYKVDPNLKALQEVAVRTILNNVRIMTFRG